MTFSFILTTLLSAGTIGAVATIITNKVTNKTARKQQFITTITQQRDEWRETIRKEAVEFYGVAYNISDKLSGNALDEELFKDRRRLRELETLLYLRMNDLNMACSKEIIENTKKVADLLSNNSDKKEELFPTLEKLKCCIRQYLEHSWNIAKREAENGDLKTKQRRCNC
jgi:hypothetical protein